MLKKTGKIAIVGQPNAGKSTLFNVLSDVKTNTSNFAGTSVDLTSCMVNYFGNTLEFIDLPGTYSLNPGDNAEKVTIDYLESNEVGLIVNVIDSSLLARSLELTMELAEYGRPMIIALNMFEEARKKGIEIYPNRLEEEIGVPVIPVSAIHGKGIKRLIDKCFELAAGEKVYPKKQKFTHHFEIRVNELEREISPFDGQFKGSNRYYAVKSLENPSLVPNPIMQRLNGKLEEIEKENFELHKTGLVEMVSYERHHAAMALAEKISKLSKPQGSSITEEADKWLLHPYFGFVGLLLFFSLIFTTIFFIGDFLTGLMDPGVQFVAGLYEPLRSSSPYLFAVVDGAYQGLAGALGIVLPYFLPLIFLTAFFEDTGYLARLAFLVDVFMDKIGLHGKSVAAFILGIGCSVPAIYATRILESKRDRLLTAILIPFVPCSARIAVIFALTAALAGPLWAVAVFAFVLLVIAVNGRLISKFLKKPTGLVLEIPELRRPDLRITFRKTKFKTWDFLKDAVPFLIIGSIVLAYLELLNVNEYLNIFFTPLLNYVMGLPEELGSTLVFGFFRKELILVMANQALGVESIASLPLTSEQVIIFVVFVTLYFPCFTTFVVIWKEFGGRTAVASAVLSILVAAGSALIFRLIFEVKNLII